MEKTMQQLAIRYPAFAGYAYAAPGSDTLVVGIKGAENIVHTLPGVVEFLTSRNVIAAGAPVVARQARHSFLELDAWRDSVQTRLFALTEATMVDLDELNYLLIVGVAPSASRDRVIAVMREAGVPRSSYAIVAWKNTDTIFR
jgi:hypothetical protein